MADGQEVFDVLQKSAAPEEFVGLFFFFFQQCVDPDFEVSLLFWCGPEGNNKKEDSPKPNL